MHSDDGNNVISGNVPAFLIKLWRLVNDRKYDSFIGWSESGNTFQVHDQVSFAHEILPMYFKHNNFTSFVRQLNMYGFRKIVGTEKGSLKVEGTVWEFHNPNFQRGHPELLEYVKRKINPNEEKKLKPEVYEKMLTDLKKVQGKQEIMNQSFENLKGQNENMWEEIMDLRQKHRRQQIVINKLVHFIYNLINQSSLGLGNKRLMVPERDSLSPKRPRLNQQIISSTSSQPSILEMPDSPVSSPLPPSSAGFDPPAESNIVLPQIESATLPPTNGKNSPQLKLVIPTTTAYSLSTPTFSSPDSTPSSALVAMDTIPNSILNTIHLNEPSLAVAPITNTTVEATSSDPLGKNPRLVADYCDQIESNLEGLQKLLGTEYSVDPATISGLFDDNDYVMYPDENLLDALVMSDGDNYEPSSETSVQGRDKDIPSESALQIVEPNGESQARYGQNAIEWPFSDPGVLFPENGEEDQVNNLDLPSQIFEL